MNILLLLLYLRVVLNECEARSLILREERGLYLFGNSVLRRPKTEELSRGWRTLQNEELYNLRSSPNEGE
jgi:hypothetical protein